MKSIVYAVLVIGLLRFSHSFSVLDTDQETDGIISMKNAAPRDEPNDAPDQPIKCYECDSEEEGACSDEEYGVEKECVEGYGCLISKETKSGTEKPFFVRGCLFESENECETFQDDGTTIKRCACSTDLCNKNWDDAGELPDGPTDAPTEPAVKTVKCYSCDSNNGECDEENTGTEMDCPVEYGCNIMTNNDNLYTRGCSVTEESGCTDDTLTHNCNCKTALCNKNWETAGAEKKMKCYFCDSHDGECDESHPGTEKDCSVEEGCVIHTDVFEGKRLFVRGCSGELESQGCNNEDNATTCICLEPLCNFDWSTAGSTTANSDTTKPVPTTEPGPTIRCYKCNSDEEGACSDEEYGVEKECVEGYGCLISKETTPGTEKPVFIRDCLVMSENEYTCQKFLSEEGTTLETCACSTELCNKNWADAGEQPDGPTDAPTEPAVKTVKCYSCDSNNGECDEENTGTEMDCPEEYGCNIMTNNDNLYTRGCSVTEEPGCTDDTLTHNCNCKTALCNKNWETAGAEKKMKCYFCDSHDGECDDSHPGTEKDCSVEEGCVIHTDVFEGKRLFDRGCSGELEAQGCNNEDNATTCLCLEPLCNFDWSTAGSTTASPDTTEAGPTIKCYRCDSTSGDCSEDAHGEETECPESKGCTIRKTTGKDGGNVMMRDCSTEKDALCDTIDNGEDGGTSQFCNCDTPLCNADWTSAGSTEIPPHTEKTTTHDTQTTAAPGAAMKISSALAVAFGVAGALVVFV